jgi:hypothetical protein
VNQFDHAASVFQAFAKTNLNRITDFIVGTKTIKDKNINPEKPTVCVLTIISFSPSSPLPYLHPPHSQYLPLLLSSIF